MPLRERLAHRNWKARVSAYQQLAQLGSSDNILPANIGLSVSEIWKQIVVESNAIALDKGLDLILFHVTNLCSSAGSLGISDINFLLTQICFSDKVMGNTRPTSKKKISDIVFKIFEDWIRSTDDLFKCLHILFDPFASTGAGSSSNSSGGGGSSSSSSSKDDANTVSLTPKIKLGVFTLIYELFMQEFGFFLFSSSASSSDLGATVPRFASPSNPKGAVNEKALKSIKALFYGEVLGKNFSETDAKIRSLNYQFVGELCLRYFSPQPAGVDSTVQIDRIPKEISEKMRESQLRELQEKTQELLKTKTAQNGPPSAPKRAFHNSIQFLQQQESSAGGGGGGGEDLMDQDAPENSEDAEQSQEEELIEIENFHSKFAVTVPDFHEKIKSSKWALRKEALDQTLEKIFAPLEITPPDQPGPQFPSPSQTRFKLVLQNDNDVSKLIDLCSLLLKIMSTDKNQPVQTSCIKLLTLLFISIINMFPAPETSSSNANKSLNQPPSVDLNSIVGARQLFDQLSNPLIFNSNSPQSDGFLGVLLNDKLKEKKQFFVDVIVHSIQAILFKPRFSIRIETIWDDYFDKPLQQSKLAHQRDSILAILIYGLGLPQSGAATSSLPSEAAPAKKRVPNHNHFVEKLDRKLGKKIAESLIQLTDDSTASVRTNAITALAHLVYLSGGLQSDFARSVLNTPPASNAPAGGSGGNSAAGASGFDKIKLDKLTACVEEITKARNGIPPPKSLLIPAPKTQAPPAASSGKVPARPQTKLAGAAPHTTSHAVPSSRPQTSSTRSAPASKPAPVVPSTAASSSVVAKSSAASAVPRLRGKGTAVSSTSTTTTDNTKANSVAEMDMSDQEVVPPRSHIDISAQISPTLLQKFENPQWGVRLEAVKGIERIIQRANKSISSDGLDDLIDSLKHRLASDSNVNLVLAVRQLVTLIAQAGGPEIVDKYSKVLMQPLLCTIGDSKKPIRDATCMALDAWTNCRQFYESEPMMRLIVKNVEKLDSTAGRVDFLRFLAVKLGADQAAIPPITEFSTSFVHGVLKPLLPLTIHWMQDRTAEVRNLAETLLPALIRNCGMNTVKAHCKDLKPSIQQTIINTVDKYKEAMIGPGPIAGAAMAPEQEQYQYQLQMQQQQQQMQQMQLQQQQMQLQQQDAAISRAGFRMMPTTAYPDQQQQQQQQQWPQQQRLQHPPQYHPVANAGVDMEAAASKESRLLRPGTFQSRLQRPGSGITAPSIPPPPTSGSALIPTVGAVPAPGFFQAPATTFAAAANSGMSTPVPDYMEITDLGLKLDNQMETEPLAPPQSEAFATSEFRGGNIAPDTGMTVPRLIVLVDVTDMTNSELAINAMKELSIRMQSDTDWVVLMPHLQELTSRLTEQIRIGFERACVGLVTVRVCKYLLNTLMQLFSRKSLAIAVTHDKLFGLVDQLLCRLLDEKLPSLEEGQRLLRALNTLMLKILENSDRTYMFTSLLRLLTQSHEQQEKTMVPERQQQHRKYSELVVKCLLKLTRALAATIDRIDVDLLLLELHQFLTIHPPSKFKNRDDLSLRAVKTILNEIVKVRGEDVRKHLRLIPVTNDPLIVSYIELTLNSASKAAKKQQPPPPSQFSQTM